MEALDVDNFDFISECIVFCKHIDVHKKWGSAYKKLNYGQNIVKTFREFKNLIEPKNDPKPKITLGTNTNLAKDKGKKDIISAFQRLTEMK